MSRPGDPDIVTGTGSADRAAAVVSPHPQDCRDPWLRLKPEDGMTPPFAGQPGHGSTAFLRNQPVRIVDGRVGGYTGVYELICPSCGDHRDLDYSQVPSRLQWLRGPRRLEAALAAYHKHLGIPWPTRLGLEASGAWLDRPAARSARNGHRFPVGWDREQSPGTGDAVSSGAAQPK